MYGLCFLLLLLSSIQVVSAEEYQFVQQWGEQGSGDGYTYSPQGVAVSNSGHIYVVDAGNERIQKFTLNGGHVPPPWGGTSTSIQQFRAPTDVAVDSAGNVYVTDWNSIKKFSPDGTPLTMWGSQGSEDRQFNGCTGIAVDSSGNVYVVDAGNRRIQKFDSVGNFLGKFGSYNIYGDHDNQFSDLGWGIAVDRDGYIYVTDRSKESGTTTTVIKKFSPGFDFVAKWSINGIGMPGELTYIEGISVDRDGNVYALFSSSVVKFNSAGQVVARLTERSATFYAHDIAVDGTGNLYITGYNPSRIVKYAPKIVATPVTASFIASPSSGTAPLTVQFVDASSGSPTAWSWSFGDGSTSTQQHPSHVYTSAGTYTARLTVSKAGVTSSTTTRTITVTGSSGGSLTASFIATPTSGTAPLTVQFIDASSGSPTSWSWSFGDGSTSTQQHPSHVYTSAGTYTARLTVSKAGVASSTTTQTITVSGSTTTAPWYVPHVLPATIQAEDYDKTGSGTAYYDTTAANEGGAYRSDGVDIERLSSGGYTVCYIREGEWTRYTVESPTTATYPVSFRVSRWLDPARTIDVYVDSGLQKTITVPKTTSSSVFTTVSTSLTIPAGRHTIMLKYHGGSMNLDSFTLGGSAPQPTGLIAAFSSTSTSGAAPLTVRFTDTSTGSPTSWSWSFGDGSTSTLQSPSHVYTTPGTYTVWLTVAKAGAGSSSATRTVTVTSGSSGRDLLFTSFNGPDTGIRGRTIAIDATIKNQGAQTASGFYVRYYLSSDATVTTGDRLLFTRYIGSLANGASSTTRAYVSIPSTVAVGTYYLGGIIDPTSRVSETNEGNNVKVDTGRLRIS